MLELVNLTEFADHYPKQLSGGMQQRVGIARALAIQPEILLMDEPFSALDEFTREKLHDDLLGIWRKTNKTIIFVTHNIAEAVYLSDKICVLSPHPGRLSAVVPVNLPRRRILEAKWLVMLVWLAGVAVVWEIFAFRVEAVKRTPENIMPHIWQIVQAIFSTDTVTRDQTALQVVLTSAGQTLERAALGFLIGTILGFALALLMHLFRGVEKTVSPYLIIIQVIPILGMAPIVLAITGDIGVSRIVIAAILTFYPVAANTLSGFRATEREKKELMYSYAANKFQLYTKTYIPNCIPYFFTGLKISAPMAITASILVDTLQGDGGLGCMLSQAQKHAMSIYVFWLIVLFSACIGILSFTIMGWLENAVCPYRRTGTNRRGGKRHGRKK